MTYEQLEDGNIHIIEYKYFDTGFKSFNMNKSINDKQYCFLLVQIF